MHQTLANQLKYIAFLPDSEGKDVKMKFYPEPKIKPPRRKPSVTNKTNAPEYMSQYMKEYRGEGKDYQKIPDATKQYRRDQRKKLKEKLQKNRPLQAALIDQELTFWSEKAQPVDLNEFEFICARRGFNEEEKKILAEELCDLDLIII